jgi:hypothetical protein
MIIFCQRLQALYFIVYYKAKPPFIISIRGVEALGAGGTRLARREQRPEAPQGLKGLRS